jgi:hypothetical protein
LLVVGVGVGVEGVNVSVNTFVQAYSTTSNYTTHSAATSQMIGWKYDEMPHKNRVSTLRHRQRLAGTLGGESREARVDLEQRYDGNGDDH